MPSSASHKALRVLAAVLGLCLFVPVLAITVVPGHGWNASVVLALFAFGGASGMLFYFARTGRRGWRAGLLLPAIAIAQAGSVLAALAAFPHSGAMHIGAAVVASWCVVLGAWAWGAPRRDEQDLCSEARAIDLER